MGTLVEVGSADGASGFDAFYRSEHRALFRQALLIVGDPATAEDVVADSFAKAWARWRRVSQMERPGGWMQTTVVRAAIKAKRRQGKWEALSDAGSVDPPPADRSLSAGLVAVLGALPIKQRAVFVLHVVEELPTGEIASLLGCAESTVRVHLHRARTALARVDRTEVTHGR